MNIKLIWPGRTRNRNLAGLEEEYLKRIRRFHKVDVQVFRAGRNPDPDRRMEEEASGFLARLDGRDEVIALTEKGREMTSGEFAKWLEERMVYGGDLAFLVGGENGYDPSVLARADHRMALSQMTWTHEMARVLLVEQIYRAFTIIRNVRYGR